MALTIEQRLRMYLADQLQDESDDSQAFFKDAEIEDLLEQANQNLNLAILLGWAIKTARYSELIDVEESGSGRKLSQKYKQAVMQLKHWQDVVAREELHADASARVVARVASILGSAGETVLVNEFVGEEPTSVRQYPSKRAYPAILK